MSRLIDADALKEKLSKGTIITDDLYGMGIMAGVDHAIKILADTPTIEVEPVRHGRWELHGNDDDCGCSYFCSECHKSYDEDWFYTNGEYTPFKCCPNCIAKMDGNQ